MKYNTNYEYTPEVLERVAIFCAFWDKKFSSVGTRLEKWLYNERQLYLQYMFIHQVPDPLCPSVEIIQRWLKPSEGFHVYEQRLILLKRLYEYTAHKDFNTFGKPRSQGDLNEVLRWHRYHKKIFDQSRALYERITTQDIVDSELKLWPFYHAMDLYRQKQGSGSEDFFEESHHEVVKLVSRFNPDSAIKILDIGCGDGRLLLEFRRKFPDAELYATNFFETMGVAEKLTQDSKFQLKVCTVEEMDFPADFFDVIVSTEVIEHLRNPSLMVEKVHYHLKPGGVFVVSAPSVHTRFLSRNPLTYIEGAMSTLFDRILPPFHQLYEAMTDLPIVHHAFTYSEFKKMFSVKFPKVKIMTMRFTHLRKFRLHHSASSIPLLNRFGGLVVAVGQKSALN